MLSIEYPQFTRNDNTARKNCCRIVLSTTKEGKKMNNLQLIETVLYYIDENICEELTYERLAEVFGYSSFHFHKIFSSVTNLSITEYIRKRRLTIAHKKLC